MDSSNHKQKKEFSILSFIKELEDEIPTDYPSTDDMESFKTGCLRRKHKSDNFRYIIKKLKEYL